MKKFCVILVAVALVVLMISCSEQEASEPLLKSDDATKHTIPYPSGYITNVSGASSYQNMADHFESPYFQHPDFYNMKSTDTITILSNFKTYQQTTEYHSGPAAALMVAYHFGKTDDDELSIGEIMQTHFDLNGNNVVEPSIANERGEWGTSTDRMIRYFDYLGWETTSSLTEGKLDGGATFDKTGDFRDFVIANLKDNTPILVEWCDWSGHWQAIIGYDTMGTDFVSDDVIIFADPYDTSDHFQDGYYIANSERFFYMWNDHNILPESQSIQQWIVAKPSA